MPSGVARSDTPAAVRGASPLDRMSQPRSRLNLVRQAPRPRLPGRNSHPKGELVGCGPRRAAPRASRLMREAPMPSGLSTAPGGRPDSPRLLLFAGAAALTLLLTPALGGGSAHAA